MLNNVYFSTFVNDSTARPMTQYSPNVNPYVEFPTIDFKVGDFLAASGYPINTDWNGLGLEYMDKCKTELDLRDSLGKLSNLSYKVSTVLEDDNLNESQKERLQEILDKVEEIEEYVKQAKSVEQKKAAIKSIEELAEEAGALSTEIAEEIQQAAEEAAQEAENADESGQTPANDINAPLQQDLTDEQKTQALDICQSIYQGAIGVVGTDYDYIIDGYNGKQGTSAINKDNVTAVLNKWQEQFAKTSGDENLIETLFDEEMLWNPSLSKRDQDGKIAKPKNNVDIIWNIVKCLEEKAKELNVYNDVCGFFTTAYDELDDTFVNQSKVQDAVMAINKAVTNAENIKKAEDKKNEAKEAKEAEIQDKKLRIETDAKNLFIGDMREIWADDELELSDKVQYKNGKFVVRIEGRDYSAKTFRELANKLTEAGYDPKKYLTKQQLAVAA